MALDLIPDAPADTAPAARNIATIITIDGVPVRLFTRIDGALVIQPGGRSPLVLDRFQAGALRLAIIEAAP